MIGFRTRSSVAAERVEPRSAIGGDPTANTAQSTDEEVHLLAAQCMWWDARVMPRPAR